MMEQDYETRLESLRRDVSELRSLLKEMAANAKGAARGYSNDRMARLREQVDHGVERAKAAYDSLREKGHDAARTVNERVRERPVVTALMALGVGLVVGRLFLTRRK